MKKKYKKLWKNKIFQFFFCLLIALFLYFIIALIYGYKDFVKINLKTNTSSIFSLTDLSVSDLNYGDIEDSARTIFGNPNKIETFKDGNIKYKTYYYDGLELTFKKTNNSYIFMKAIITSDKYYITRNIKVGDRINDVMNKFYVKDSKGEYMYGNYNENDLNGKKVTDTLFFAHRKKNLVYYIYADKPYKNKYASLKDDIAQLTFKVSFGKVSKIDIMYGPLE